MVKIIISGLFGRMGQQIYTVANLDPELQIVAGTERKLSHDLEHIRITTDIEEVINTADVVIDFTSPESSLNTLSILSKHHKPIVIGTTGFNKNELDEIKLYSHKIPIVQSSNMGIGINIVSLMLNHFSDHLLNHFSPKIIESHHVHKKDAPSGTALLLKNNLTLKDIPIESIREGEIIGQHIVRFESEYEVIEIKHEALNRALFAKGALLSAKWLIHRKPGLYSMHDVLGLSK